jgi:3' terminal RNA ribose 2'-O-methyltransferase Hen1
MLLTLTSTTPPARDLGYLLRKHPDRLQTFELQAGSAHVFYPEANDERCTAALLLDIDPVRLVRGKPASSEGGLVEAYVNDRPYAISSFLSVAISRVFGSALGGRSDPPELAERRIALEAIVTPIRDETGDFAQRLFAPLDYVVHAEPVAVPDEARAGIYRRLSVSATTTLRALLTHLYVLIPVMDNQKHYWVGDEEVEKLFRHGGDWLAHHPERELITRRYLKRAPSLARAALERLRALDDGTENGSDDRSAELSEAALERPLRLADQRIAAVAAVIREARAKTLLDLGCGEGDLIAALAGDTAIDRILGIDVSARELARATERLSKVAMMASRRERIELLQSSLLYVDRRLTGFEAATALEVIEHLNPDRLPTFERILFEQTRPRLVVLTTPNREYNARFPALANGRLRHVDHRFEWTREEFAGWANGVAARHGYAVSYAGIGEDDPHLGTPTQMAVFRCN